MDVHERQKLTLFYTQRHAAKIFFAKRDKHRVFHDCQTARVPE